MNPQSVQSYTPSMVSMNYQRVLHNGLLGKSILQCLDSSTRAANTPCVESSRLWDDELDNCTDEVDMCPCSAKLAKRETQKELIRGSRLSESTIADGSLPSSPEDDSLTNGPICDFSRSPVGMLDQETRELIQTFFAEYTGLCTTSQRRNEAFSTMKRVVAKVVDKHQFAYNGMIRKLSLDQQSDDMTIIRAVAREIFSDGTTNWGRIASLVAFGAEVCRYLKETGREHCVKAVGQQISSYLLLEQQQWLLNNKAWDGFVEFFHVEDTESLLRSALLAFASVAGIGAGLALLIR